MLLPGSRAASFHPNPILAHWNGLERNGTLEHPTVPAAGDKIAADRGDDVGSFDTDHHNNTRAKSAISKVQGEAYRSKQQHGAGKQATERTR